MSSASGSSYAGWCAGETGPSGGPAMTDVLGLCSRGATASCVVGAGVGRSGGDRAVRHRDRQAGAAAGVGAATRVRARGRDPGPAGVDLPDHAAARRLGAAGRRRRPGQGLATGQLVPGGGRPRRPVGRGRLGGAGLLRFARTRRAGPGRGRVVDRGRPARGRLDGARAGGCAVPRGVAGDGAPRGGTRRGRRGHRRRSPGARHPDGRRGRGRARAGGAQRRLARRTRAVGRRVPTTTGTGSAPDVRAARGRCRGRRRDGLARGRPGELRGLDALRRTRAARAPPSAAICRLARTDPSRHRTDPRARASDLVHGDRGGADLRGDRMDVGTPWRAGVVRGDRVGPHACAATCSETWAMSAGPTRQQPPTRRAPAVNQPVTSPASKADSPVQVRASASQPWPELG